MYDLLFRVAKIKDFTSFAVFLPTTKRPVFLIIFINGVDVV